MWCGVGTCGAGDHEVAQPDGGDHQHPVSHDVGSVFLHGWHIRVVVLGTLVLPRGPRHGFARRPHGVQDPGLARHEALNRAHAVHPLCHGLLTTVAGTHKF